MTVTSVPALLEQGSGLPGLILAIVVISLGTAGVKASLPPFLGA
jgi:POT family proton-dependent oligopeptide transporter